jgi:3-mercaptopyruvate sulfurtransferase SseA
LKQIGITRVRPLLGGLKAWEDAGLPLQDFFPADESREITESHTA